MEDEGEFSQSFSLEQNDHSWQLGLGHRWSRRWEAGLSYFHLASRAEGFSSSTVKGPGAFINWQPTRRDLWNLQVSRLQLQIADQNSVGEFGSLQYQRNLGRDSELLMRVEKSFDSARASFDDVTNNQFQLSARRNRIMQGLVQLTRAWRSFRLSTDWNYLEFETPTANPAFSEHRANARLEWLLSRNRSQFSGVELRKSQTDDAGSREDLELTAVYTGYQIRFIPDLGRKLRGSFETGLRAESSDERISQRKIRRLAATIAIGAEF